MPLHSLALGVSAFSCCWQKNAASFACTWCVRVLMFLAKECCFIRLHFWCVRTLTLLAKGCCFIRLHLVCPRSHVFGKRMLLHSLALLVCLRSHVVGKTVAGASVAHHAATLCCTHSVYREALQRHLMRMCQSIKFNFRTQTNIHIHIRKQQSNEWQHSVCCLALWYLGTPCLCFMQFCCQAWLL